MSSWPPNDALDPVAMELVGPLSPLEVLYDFEGPSIFTAVTASKTLVLAYLSEELEAEALLRFVVASTSPSTIAAMREGVVSVREALERGSLWLVDLDYQYQPKRAFAVGLDELPEDALPAATTMLWSELEPALLVRLEGPEIRRGVIPAAVIAQAAEIATKALKPIFEWAARDLRQEISGRPPEWLRLLYGLPTQRIAYGSLEVAFRSVDPSEQAQGDLPLGQDGGPSPRDIHQTGWQALRDGLAWAVAGSDVPEGEGEEDRWLAILEAMRRLAPASTGPVTSIQVSGRLVGRSDRPYALDRESTQRIRSTLADLKRHHEVRLRVFTGRVRELDLDKLTMILRDVPGEPTAIQLALDDDQLLETAREAHYRDLEVSVAARSADRKTWTVGQIEFVQGGDADGPVDPAT